MTPRSLLIALVAGHQMGADRAGVRAQGGV